MADQIYKHLLFLNSGIRDDLNFNKINLTTEISLINSHTGIRQFEFSAVHGKMFLVMIISKNL